jgi:hypothetical protein
MRWYLLDVAMVRIGRPAAAARCRGVGMVYTGFGGLVETGRAASARIMTDPSC